MLPKRQITFLFIWKLLCNIVQMLEFNHILCFCCVTPEAVFAHTLPVSALITRTARRFTPSVHGSPKHTHTHTHTHTHSAGFLRFSLVTQALASGVKGRPGPILWELPGPGVATRRFCDGAVTNFTLPMKDEPANKRSLKSRGNSSTAVKSKRKRRDWGKTEDYLFKSVFFFHFFIGRRLSTLNDNKNHTHIFSIMHAVPLMDSFVALLQCSCVMSNLPIFLPVVLLAV